MSQISQVNKDNLSGRIFQGLGDSLPQNEEKCQISFSKVNSLTALVHSYGSKALCDHINMEGTEIKYFFSLLLKKIVVELKG